MQLPRVSLTAAISGFLAQLRENGASAVPQNYLTDDLLAAPVAQGPELAPQHFTTKGEAAKYLQETLASVSGPGLEEDVGLWSWLSLYFFDSVCPEKDGKRKPVAEPHYILHAHNYQRRYRHLLLTPYRILAAMPTEHNRIFLNALLPVHGELIEQTVSRLRLFRIPAVRELIDRLYYDAAKGRPKVGIANSARPKQGDLRTRLPARIDQLRLIYDIGSLTGDLLIQKLGKEFAGWLR